MDILTSILDLLSGAWALFWVGVGLVGLVLFARWMLEEAGSLLTKKDREREEAHRLAELNRREILREERERVANETVAQTREDEERARKTRLNCCHHEWVPVPHDGSPNGATSWRCDQCEAIASHDERALDASLDAAWRRLEQSTEGVQEAIRNASEVADELRAFREGLSFDQEAFELQEERKHLERVKESFELHGTPIPSVEASRIAHYAGLGEPIVTNRESLIAIERGLPETNGEQRMASHPEFGGLVCVHTFGLDGGGKTFVSVNLAVMLAGLTELDTAIVALDEMSDIHEFFGQESRSDVQELLAIGEHSDHDRIRAVGDQVGEHVWAFARRDPAAGSPTLDSWVAFLKALRTDFSYVVVDTCGGFSDVELASLETADISLLILNGPSDVGLRHTMKILPTLAAGGVPLDRMRIVVNRYEERQATTPEAASSYLQLDISGIIPISSLARSSRGARIPVVLDHPESDITAAFRELADATFRELEDIP